MKIFINNKRQRWAKICPPELNYGQLVREDYNKRIPFEAKIKYKEFEKKVKNNFYKLYNPKEIKEFYEKDDRKTFPEVFEYMEKDFPSYNDLLRDDKILLKNLLLYFEYQFAHAVFNGKCGKYSLQKIEDIKFEDEYVSVSGLVFKY